MAIEIFLVPMVQIRLNDRGMPHSGPKYVSGNPNINGFSAVWYSRLTECVVLVKATGAVLTAIRSNPDVVSVATAANIDNPINASKRDNIRAYLEAREVPAQWVNTGDTRRQLIRGLIGIYLFGQRLEEHTGLPIKDSFQQAGVTLNDEWQTLPQNVKNMLLSTAASNGWSNPGFDNTVTVREILKYFSDQYESAPIVMAGVVI